MVSAIPVISISSKDLYDPGAYPGEGFYIVKTDMGTEELIFCFGNNVYVITTLNFHDKDVIINRLLNSLPRDTELLFENQLLREKIKLLENEIRRLNEIIDKMDDTMKADTVIKILDKFKQLFDEFRSKKEGK